MSLVIQPGISNQLKDKIIEIDGYIKNNNISDMCNDMIEGNFTDNYIFYEEGIIVKVYKKDGAIADFYLENDYHSLNKEDAFLYRLMESFGIDCLPKLYAYVESKYLVMEYIEGQSLKDMGEAFLSEQEALNGLYDNLSKMAIHKIETCDLHTENMIFSNGKIYIIDIGEFRYHSEMVEDIIVPPSFLNLELHENINADKMKVELSNFLKFAYDSNKNVIIRSIYDDEDCYYYEYPSQH